MSRPLIEILQKNDLYTENIVATNLEGGDGARGWGFLYDQKGNPYHISSTSGSFMTTPLAADTPWGPTSFTPIGMLAIDDTLFIVKEDYPLRLLEEFVAAAKEEPLPIGGIATINIDFIMAELLSQQAGFELKYVALQRRGGDDQRAGVGGARYDRVESGGGARPGGVRRCEGSRVQRKKAHA